MRVATKAAAASRPLAAVLRGRAWLWSPELTSKQIMSEACAKLTTGRQPMLRFYETIEKATAEVPPTIRGYAWRLPRAREPSLCRQSRRSATAALKEALPSRRGRTSGAHCARTRHVGQCAGRLG